MELILFSFLRNKLHWPCRFYYKSLCYVYLCMSVWCVRGEGNNPCSSYSTTQFLTIQQIIATFCLVLSKNVLSNNDDDLRCFRLPTISSACLADRSANQLSPSSTMISFVWTSFPGIKASEPNGTCKPNRKFYKI